MGLAEFLNPEITSNPFYQGFDQNRSKIMGLGAALSTGTNKGFSQALSPQLQLGMAQDTQRQEARQAVMDAEAQKAKTIEFLTAQGQTDLIEPLNAGLIDGPTAFAETQKRLAAANAQPNYDVREFDGNLVAINPNDPLNVQTIAQGSVAPQSAPTVKTVTRDDGSEVAVQWDGAKGEWVPINAPQGGGTLTPQGQDLTESQSKLTLFRTMQTEAAPALEDIERRWDPSNVSDAAARATPLLGNFFQSEEGQIYNAAASAWAEGALRIATGAAATPQEMERTRNTYFAQVGDTPNTIAYKAQLRAMYDRAIQAALGSPSQETLPTPSEFFSGAQSSTTPPQSSGGVVDYTEYFKAYG